MEEIQKIKSLCAKYGIRPSKKLGQNFLVDASVARMMMDAAKLDAEDSVVEVGPGLGALTVEMAKRVKQVVAVEVDRKMYEAAKEILAPYKNVEVVQGDILKIANQKLVALFHNPPQPSLILREGDRSVPPLKIRGGEGGVMSRPYKVVASLPYSITSAVLRKFTEEEPRQNFPTENLGGQARPELIVVMVQKEVAERVCAPPGEMSVLSVAVQYYSHPEIVALVPRSAFWPSPEVDSAILRITPFTSPPYLKGEEIGVDEKRLFQLVRLGFSSRRKQLQNNLMAGLRLPRESVVKALTAAGLNPQLRAQELAVEDWIALSRLL